MTTKRTAPPISRTCAKSVGCGITFLTTAIDKITNQVRKPSYTGAGHII